MSVCLSAFLPLSLDRRTRLTATETGFVAVAAAAAAAAVAALTLPPFFFSPVQTLLARSFSFPWPSAAFISISS